MSTSRSALWTRAGICFFSRRGILRRSTRSSSRRRKRVTRRCTRALPRMAPTESRKAASRRRCSQSFSLIRAGCRLWRTDGFLAGLRPAARSRRSTKRLHRRPSTRCSRSSGMTRPESELLLLNRGVQDLGSGGSLGYASRFRGDNYVEVLHVGGGLEFTLQVVVHFQLPLGFWFGALLAKPYCIGVRRRCEAARLGKKLHL